MKKKMNRRDFLRIASIGTASAIALSCGLIEEPLQNLTEEPDTVSNEIPQSDSSVRNVEVLVIGAGMSGLAAARTLVDKDLSVIVYDNIPNASLYLVLSRLWKELKVAVNRASISSDLFVKKKPCWQTARLFLYSRDLMKEWSIREDHPNLQQPAYPCRDRIQTIGRHTQLCWCYEGSICQHDECQSYQPHRHSNHQLQACHSLYRNR